ncbi:hypothetical protein NIES2119_31325 [[Phormidium ambiguum] IAM M-71]|uniref:Uncharacterized protein n=1 Tax=[Phormidium ambiguum] IAM M-71 TaxID=454136 RepID=A0A1U7I2H5_9CYAN|nr:helix-turn-helix domain-containing protein [Phormidium ambiguum]OKH30226.1 hypothetical protein NIES2119_31325 [Phormidium ambiguum IAM M-71]
MADSVAPRPFDNFRVAITDPLYFFGRNELLAAIERSPFQVRILLGGRRIGKTSFLRAVEWTLLNLSTSKLFPTPRNKTHYGWIEKLFSVFSHQVNFPTKFQQPIPSSKQLVREGNRAFPVFINLQVEQPKDLDSLRYLLIARLRETMNCWRAVPVAALREMYRQFLSQVAGGEVTVGFLSTMNLKVNIRNPEHEKRLPHDNFRQGLLATINELQTWHFDGVCFLLDGAEFVVSQNWANDAWSYLRGLKDTDTALKPFVGFLLSGYRSLKDYQQAVGSPLLNIAEVNWLTSLTSEQVQALIIQRCQEENFALSETDIAAAIEWAGGHPYLTQQLLNCIFDDYQKAKFHSVEHLKYELLRLHERDFSAWWNDSQRPYSLGATERAVYWALIENRQGTAESLSQQTQLSYSEVADALDVLLGTGVIQKVDDELCRISTRLFEEWVVQQPDQNG